MSPDPWSLYALMLRSRLFEVAVSELWREGLISGEMHLGTGEEAIIAGIVAQLHDDDAMALDHRGTAALLMRGADPALVLRELLGHPSGLCHGMGGHMHLFSREHLAASSGIVGATGPAAAGFALAAQYAGSGAIAVAFFGEGAVNQGMLMESLNLASAWNLPALFVCKDDGWSVVTRSQRMTGGNLSERARGLGVPAIEVDGLDVCEVWAAARSAIQRARSGHGPAFLHAHCVHLEGHFLGLQLLRVMRHPLREVPQIAGALMHSLLQPGGAVPRERVAGLREVLGALLATASDPRRDSAHDPVGRARERLREDPVRLRELESQIEQETRDLFASVLEQVPS